MSIKQLQMRQIGQYMVVCGIPLFIVLAVLPVSTIGFELPKFVALSLGATICALAFVLQPVDILAIVTRNTAGKALLLFMGIVVVSLLWSVAPLSSLLGVAPRFHGVLTYLSLFSLCLGAAALAGNTKGKKLLVTTFLTSNTAVVLYGVLQILHLDPFSTIWQSEAFLGRIFSTLGHPNALAQCIVLTVPFVALQLARSTQQVYRLWWFVILILNVVVLFSTASRSGLIGLFVLACFCMPALKRQLRLQRDAIKLKQAFGLSLMVVLCFTFGFVFFMQRYSLSYESGRSEAARLEIWESVGNMYLDRPFGWGLETLAFVTPRYLTKNIYAHEPLTVIIDRAHNELFQLLVTIGPLGTLAYLGLIVTVLFNAWRFRKLDKDGLQSTAAVAVLGFQATLLFGFPTIATSAMFWVFIGILVALLPGKEKVLSRWQGKAVQYFLLVICVASLVISLQWLQARWVHGYARALWDSDLAVALAVHQEGLLTFGYDRESIIEAAEAHLIAAQQVEDNAIILDSVQTMASMLATVTSGEDGMQHVLLAWSHALAGNEQEARSSLATANTYFTNSITYHRAAAYIYGLLGDSVAVHKQESLIRGLLPDAYFTAGSETRRILLKLNPWLENL